MWKTIMSRQISAIFFATAFAVNVAGLLFFNTPYVDFIERVNPYSSKDLTIIGIFLFTVVPALAFASESQKWVEKKY